MAKTIDYGSSVYGPHDAGMTGYQSSQQAAEHSRFGIDLDVPGTDIKDYFAPLLPWEICAVQAQTSNGKTYFTDWWLRKMAAQLQRQERNEIIVKVSLEESIEAMAFDEYSRLLGIRTADLARGTFTDWARMQWAMTEIDKTQIWRIGDSANRPENAPELYLSNIYRCIKELADGNITGDKFKIAAVAIDYLQALPIDPEVKQAARDNQRRLQVAQDVFRLRSMTTHLKTPIIVNIQAKQDLTGNNPPMMIPGVYDGLETSTIATRFDRVISLWMPKTTSIIGSSINLPNFPTGYHVTDDGCFLKVNKQRGGLPAGKIWELKIDYAAHEYMDSFMRTQEQRNEKVDNMIYGG
jgi:hypothetical protein